MSSLGDLQITNENIVLDCLLVAVSLTSAPAEISCDILSMNMKQFSSLCNTATIAYTDTFFTLPLTPVGCGYDFFVLGKAGLSVLEGVCLHIGHQYEVSIVHFNCTSFIYCCSYFYLWSDNNQ